MRGLDYLIGGNVSNLSFAKALTDSVTSPPATTKFLLLDHRTQLYATSLTMSAK